MKNKLLPLFIVLVLLAVVLVACDTSTPADTQSQSQDIEPIKPSPVTFSVTFNSNGGTSISSQNKSNIEYGQTIDAPSLTPTKKGYTFDGWTLSDGTAVDFATYTITSNTTFYASWKAKSYLNKLILTDENIKSNIVDILDSQSVCDYYSTDVDICDSNNQSIVYYTGGVRTATTSTTYQESSDTDRLSIPVPKTSKENDYFVYWYYYNNGEIIQLSNRLDEDSIATEVELLIPYNFDSAIDIYAMWHSSLKNVIVSYQSGADDNSVSMLSTGTKVKDGDYLTAPQNPTRNGYVFKGWTYPQIVNGEYVFVNEKQVVETMSFYESNASKGVKINHADVIGGVFYLTANWIKVIDINSASDFEIDKTNAENQSAIINLNADITLSNWSGIFDSQNVFAGTFNGNNHTITFSSSAVSDASLLGVVNGIVKDVNIIASVMATDYSTIDGEIYIGGIASISNGTLANITSAITISIVAQDKTIYAGGIVAINNGAEITSCTAEMDADITSSSSYIGGIVGKNISGAVNSCTVNNGSTAVDIIADASANAYAGGMAGKIDNGTFTKCDIGNIRVNITAQNIGCAGGVAGMVYGNSTTKVNIASATIVIDANSAYAGGVFGKAGSILTHLNVNNATVNATGNTSAYAGAVVGENRNDGGNRGSLRFMVVRQATVNAISANGYAYAGGVVGSNIASDTSGTGGLVGYAYVNANVSVNATTNKAYISNTLGKYDNTTVCKNLFYNQNATLTLNGTTYSSTERSDVSAIVPSEDNIQNATWTNKNLYLNIDYTSSDPSTLVWTIADGSYPNLVFATK